MTKLGEQFEVFAKDIPVQLLALCFFVGLGLPFAGKAGLIGPALFILGAVGLLIRIEHLARVNFAPKPTVSSSSLDENVRDILKMDLNPTETLWLLDRIVGSQWTMENLRIVAQALEAKRWGKQLRTAPMGDHEGGPTSA